MKTKEIVLKMESGDDKVFYLELGKIESCELCEVRDVFLGCDIGFNFGGTYQSFGGFIIEHIVKRENESIVPTLESTKDLVNSINELFDTKDWHEIKGMKAYAIRESLSWNSSIVGIMTLEDNIFMRDTWAKKWFAKQYTNEYKKMDAPIVENKVKSKVVLDRLDSIE